MNITYYLNSVNQHDTCHVITFTREDGKVHIDGFSIPRDQEGNVIEEEVNRIVDEKYQHVLTKQASIDWQ